VFRQRDEATLGRSALRFTAGHRRRDPATESLGTEVELALNAGLHGSSSGMWVARRGCGLFTY